MEESQSYSGSVSFFTRRKEEKIYSEFTAILQDCRSRWKERWKDQPRGISFREFLPRSFVFSLPENDVSKLEFSDENERNYTFVNLDAYRFYGCMQIYIPFLLFPQSLSDKCQYRMSIPINTLARFLILHLCRGTSAHYASETWSYIATYV